MIIKEKQRKQREKDAKEASKRIPPWEMFKQSEEKGKYSKFDDKGIPTHLINGEEISKRQRKKLEKLYETQAKNYAEVSIFFLIFVKNIKHSDHIEAHCLYGNLELETRNPKISQLLLYFIIFINFY